jgi:hypothetical protein
MRNDAPPSHVDIASKTNFLTLAGVDPSSDQCVSCFHFEEGICVLELSLALGRDSDFCGWWNTW